MVRVCEGWRVILLIARREVRILVEDGSPLRNLMLDPDPTTSASPYRPEVVDDVSTHRSPMSRHITPRS